MFDFKPKFLFKAKQPDLEEFKGRKVLIPGKKEPIKIETICGNFTKPAFYEINGKYLIGMLRFHAQMEGDKSISEDQFKAFEEMELKAEKNPTKTILEVPTWTKKV